MRFYAAQFAWQPGARLFAVVEIAALIEGFDVFKPFLTAF